MTKRKVTKGFVFGFVFYWHILLFFLVFCVVCMCVVTLHPVSCVPNITSVWIGHYWFSIRFSLTINVISKYFFAQQWRLIGRYEW